MAEDTKASISDVGNRSAEDPILRIRDLDAATRPPMTVRTDDPLNAATTIMWLNNFSQLPVMKNNEDVEGFISWRSIGFRFSSGGVMSLVRHCMDDNLQRKIVCQQTPLLDVVYDIAEHDYVLVRDCDGKITGIVTASDLSYQFMKTAQAFVTIGEIEYHLRKLFPLPSKAERNTSCRHETPYVPGIGEYIDEMKDPKKWESIRSNLRIDGCTLAKHLKDVNRIRHDVMHFKDNFKLKHGVLSPEDTDTLQNTAQFFRDLHSSMKIRDEYQ